MNDYAQTDVALAVYENESRLVDPKLVMQHHQNTANALLELITSPDNAGVFYANIQGSKYLTYESWLLIAKFNNCHLELEGILVEVKDSEGATEAWGAYVNLIDDATGHCRARAYMECGMDSFPTKGKQGREKHKAAQSAAQTWAASKACRMAFSFVAVLAGAAATTADEMYDKEVREILYPPNPVTERRQSDSKQAQPNNPNKWEMAPIIKTANGAGGSVDAGSCALHDIYWDERQGQGGETYWSHWDGDEKGYCNPGKSVRLVAEKLFGWGQTEVNDFLRPMFAKTSSKLTPPEATEACEALSAKTAEVVTEYNPDSNIEE